MTPLGAGAARTHARRHRAAFGLRARCNSPGDVQAPLSSMQPTARQEPRGRSGHRALTWGQGLPMPSPRTARPSAARSPRRPLEATAESTDSWGQGFGFMSALSMTMPLGISWCVALRHLRVPVIPLCPLPPASAVARTAARRRARDGIRPSAGGELW
eukprot:CAMPEP_0197940280 /NCGR_PEP_ID=MMETSP1439-20131203/120966_1 /TAXON_ID=66791 /ORGANISM="Gonyaulax spinifera, Strain CCMP409" /LENGTH=157 /DNA_ID=CAMNT_0043563439 /DNA_START=24 /DNA_END=495 /DNA_ORIENTATION=-